MEDKSFVLLSKMYSEIMQKFDNMNQQFDIINRKLDEKADKTDIVRLENELKPKIEALFDGYKQHDMKLEAIEKKLDNLTDKLDRHDIKIQVIEGGRK